MLDIALRRNPCIACLDGAMILGFNTMLFLGSESFDLRS